MQKIDVLINVFSKPWQTALSLLSLLRHSGERIDKIYFQEEPGHSLFERLSHEKLLAYLAEKIVYFQPAFWLGVEPTEKARLAEEKYRLSMRYQHGFEHSDKQYVLIIHNDIIVHNDVVGYFLNEVQNYSGVGQIGQCWWCPAHQNKLCEPVKYEVFRPSFPALDQLYREGFNPLERRAYHYGWSEQIKARPWPLPECRLNEWCALVDRQKTMPDTMPFGSAAPFGAQMPSGACIGENFDEPVNLDTGVQWFRDLSHLGHRFKHVDIYEHISHDKSGHKSLLCAEAYVTKEIMAKKHILKHFPEFMAFNY